MADDAVNLREVGPGLFVGASESPKLDLSPPFHAIIDFYGQNRMYAINGPSWPIGYKRAAVVSHRSFSDGDAFPRGVLDEALAIYTKADGPMLLHCQAGLSRSPSAAYALLRIVHGLDHAEALHAVRSPMWKTMFPVKSTLESARDWVRVTRRRLSAKRPRQPARP